MRKVYKVEAFDAARIAQFAALMGDQNPLHFALGERSPADVLVPGSMMAFVAEQAISRMCQEVELIELNLIFVRPLRAGSGLTFSLREGADIPLGEQTARRARLTGTGDDGLCLIADCLLAIINRR